MVGGTDLILDHAVVALGLGHMLTSRRIIHTLVEFVGNIIRETPKFLVAMDEFEEIFASLYWRKTESKALYTSLAFCDKSGTAALKRIVLLMVVKNGGPESNSLINGS